MRRNRFLYVLYAAAAVVFVSCYGGMLPYMLFEAAVMLPIASLSYIIYVYANLDFYQTTPKKVLIKGEALPYEVQLINSGLLSFSQVKLSFYEEQCHVDGSGMLTGQSLLPGEKINLQSSIACFYRGEYEVGASEIEITDFLNLFSIKWEVKWPLKLTVMPRVVTLEQLSFLPVLVDPKHSLSQHSAETEIRENELRKYENGDLMKVIHWKASARTGQLLSRKNELEVKVNNYVLLDIAPTKAEGIDKLRLEDKMLETALAICRFLVMHEVPGTLCYYDTMLRSYDLSEPMSFDHFYQNCTHLYFDGREMISWLGEIQRRGSQQDCCIIVCHEVGEALQSYLLEEGQLHEQFVILQIAQLPLSETIIRQLEESGIIYFSIKADEDIDKVLSGGGQ